MSRCVVTDGRGNFNYLGVNKDGSVNAALTPEAEARQLAAALFGAMMANRVDGRWDSLNVKHPDTINMLAEHYDQQIELSRKIIAALKENTE